MRVYEGENAQIDIIHFEYRDIKITSNQSTEIYLGLAFRALLVGLSACVGGASFAVLRSYPVLYGAGCLLHLNGDFVARGIGLNRAIYCWSGMLRKLALGHVGESP